MPLFWWDTLHLKNQQDVFLNSEFPKDGRFLRQVTYPHPSTTIHGQVRNLLPVKEHMTAVWEDEPGEHVKSRGLARTVGTK
jgi:hypothetical protein